MWVAAGWLIPPLLEAGDNKLTIFKTSGEQERWLAGRKKERGIDKEKEREKKGKMVFCL